MKMIRTGPGIPARFGMQVVTSNQCISRRLIKINHDISTENHLKRLLKGEAGVHQVKATKGRFPFDLVDHCHVTRTGRGEIFALQIVRQLANFIGAVNPLAGNRQRPVGNIGRQNAGIPGTVGGALMMNSGVNIPKSAGLSLKGVKCISDVVKKVEAIDYNGRLIKLDRKDIKFGYRSSSLKSCIIVRVAFGLRKGKREKIKKTMNEILKYKRHSQDLKYPSAGCIFRNPNGVSASRLIDECGLKGTRINGAMISNRHANYIVNYDNATYRDFLHIIRFVQRRIKNRYNVSLKPEIKIWKN